MSEEQEYELVWVEKDAFGEGWMELRNGIVYSHDFLQSQVVRRDENGNYLVRMPKRGQAK